MQEVKHQMEILKLQNQAIMEKLNMQIQSQNMRDIVSQFNFNPTGPCNPYSAIPTPIPRPAMTYHPAFRNQVLKTSTQNDLHNLAPHFAMEWHAECQSTNIPAVNKHVMTQLNTHPTTAKPYDGDVAQTAPTLVEVIPNDPRRNTLLTQPHRSNPSTQIKDNHLAPQPPHPLQQTSKPTIHVGSISPTLSCSPTDSPSTNLKVPSMKLHMPTRNDAAKKDPHFLEFISLSPQRI
jgi:hypothetical protein